MLPSYELSARLSAQLSVGYVPDYPPSYLSGYPSGNLMLPNLTNQFIKLSSVRMKFGHLLNVCKRNMDCNLFSNSS